MILHCYLKETPLNTSPSNFVSLNTTGEECCKAGTLCRHLFQLCPPHRALPIGKKEDNQGDDQTQTDVESVLEITLNLYDSTNPPHK